MILYDRIGLVSGGLEATVIDQSLLAAVLNALPKPTLAVAGDTRVLAINALALDLLPGLRVGSLLALGLRDPSVLDAIGRVASTGVQVVVAWRDRVPVERIFQVTVASIDQAEQERCVALTLEDLTEARRIDRMRADFVANASHELRTPLASLLGFVETLQGPARDDAQARTTFLSIMAEQARRMARLIDDLLSLSRIEQKRHIKPCTPLDLSGVVRHVVDTLAPVALEQATTVTLHVTNDIVVPGDRDELVRVVENLVENAIKYGRRRVPGTGDELPGQVEVSLAIERSDAVLTVQDHGNGIASEHLPRLTERFYRIDPGESRAKGGTGLGMALVKHIVAHHRGRLEIDSVVGQGSSFIVSIPLAA